MSVMRRRRLASIAAAVAMVMAVLAVCPCPAMIAAATTEDAHGCCAGKAGLTVASGSSCCADEARESVAVSSVPVGVAAGWATDVVITVTALPIPSFSTAAAPPRAAPLILRI